MSEALSPERVEKRIQEIYRFFAQVAPGVSPREEGELGLLWKIWDDFVDDGVIERVW